MRLPLPVASYRLPSPAASCSRLVNAFAEAAPQGSQKGPALLRRAPGIRAWADVGAGPIRGLEVMAGVLYVVSGAELYSVDWEGTPTLIGPIPGDERVQMSTNGFDLVIVRPFDGTAYAYDGNTLAQITDPTFVAWGAAGVAFLDGYLVFRRPDSSQFFNSGLNALTFDGLDVASAEGQPDRLVGLTVDHRELILTGSRSTEVWYNAGLSPGSPFTRSPNGLLEIGSAASYSLGKVDNTVFWLANDLTVRRLDGQTPMRVSQHGIEGRIQRMTTVDDAFCLTYSQEGHLFYALTFPFEGATFVLDATTGEWHERESLGHGRWRVNAITEAYGLQLVGDSESGRVGVLDPDTHEEWGEPQRVSWTYQPVYADRNRVSFKRFEIALNSGHGVTEGQGENPLATLKISDDGGETFRALPTKSVGARGNYRARAAWWNLGSARERVFQIEITDPVPLFVTDTQIEADGGRL